MNELEELIKMPLDPQRAAEQKLAGLISRSHPQVNLANGQHMHEALSKVADVIADLQMQVESLSAENLMLRKELETK